MLARPTPRAKSLLMRLNVLRASAFVATSRTSVAATAIENAHGSVGGEDRERDQPVALVQDPSTILKPEIVNP